MVKLGGQVEKEAKQKLLILLILPNFLKLFNLLTLLNLLVVTRW